MLFAPPPGSRAPTGFGTAPPGYNTAVTNRQNVQAFNQPGTQGLNPQGYNASAPLPNPAATAPPPQSFAPPQMPPSGGMAHAPVMHDPGQVSPPPSPAPGGVGPVIMHD